jgi:cellulose synthase (UDP-forming)
MTSHIEGLPVPIDADRSGRSSVGRLVLVRILIALTVISGGIYIGWRWVFSLNIEAWWIAIPLVIAETYAFIDVCFFGMTLWRARTRPAPPRPVEGLTADVFITTYNEEVDLVRRTAEAAVRIRYPHKTHILDDGDREAMRTMAAELGVGYITRGPGWEDKPLHAKAGNLNNALLQTSGEFLLILDADQVPRPEILDHTLGYFADERVALVQTPQEFVNVPDHDPLGSQAPLFYGPIQQGKDGWNAAFFCGSNAVLRREALMQLGVSRYVVEVEEAITRALAASVRLLRRARRRPEARAPRVAEALDRLIAEVVEARHAVHRREESLSAVTFRLQQSIASMERDLVSADFALMAEDLRAIAELHTENSADFDVVVDVDQNIDGLVVHQLSPLGALASVRALLRSVDVDRDHEAQPLMPLATISVTEDMATSMRLHGMGWHSVYHHETLADGLAPEDLATMMKQRLRWAQGTVQVMLRENPLTEAGLTIPQRLMYFATMWSYFSGFAALAFFAGPIVFLVAGVLPVSSGALEYFLRFLPYLVISQLLFVVASRGMSTWRGQQYSLALFPVWIRSVTSAIANVWFGRPLGFVVTDKSGSGGRAPLRLVWPQLVVAILLVLATFAGIVRLVLGVGEPIGTAVNLGWVVFNLLILSVLVHAVRYRGFQPASLEGERL